MSLYNPKKFCYLFFFLRENEETSHCAVPISTNLIRQIVGKAGNEDSLKDLLADFYGPNSSSEMPWPYVNKDSDRYHTFCCILLCMQICR